MSLSYSNVSRNGSGVRGIDVEEGLEIAGLPVRVKVHHDTTYARQSWAKAEVWSQASLSWNEVAVYAWGMWANDTKAVFERPQLTQGAADAVAELKARAAAVLAR